MDIMPLVRRIGEAFHSDETLFDKYSGYKRSVLKDENSGYFEFRINKEKDIYKWDLVFVNCHYNEIPRKIFFMKLPTSGVPYSLSTSLSQMMNMKRSPLIRVAQDLDENNKFKNMLIEFVEQFINGQVEHPNNWDGDIEDFLVKRYEANKKMLSFYLSSPTTVVLNGQLLMELEEFQQIWVKNYFDVNEELNNECSCIYCGSREQLISGGKGKWKIFTDTRQTQVSKEGKSNVRCVDCETLITTGIEILNNYVFKNGQSATGEPLFNYYIPLTYDLEKLKLIYNHMTKAENEIEFIRNLISIRDNLKMNDVRYIVQLSFGNAQDNTFSLMVNKLISIDDVDVEKLSSYQYKYSKLLENHNAKEKYKINNQSLPYHLINKFDAGKFEREDFKATLIDMFLRPKSVNESKLNNYIKKLEILINREEKNVKTYGSLYNYQLYLYIAKEMNIMDIINSKEYALGVLVSIADYVQNKKYNKNGSKDYVSPIRKKFAKYPKNQTVAANEATRIISQGFVFIGKNSYLDRISRIAMNKFMDGENAPKEYQQMAYYFGLSSWNYYPNELDRDEFFNKNNKNNEENLEETLAI